MISDFRYKNKGRNKKRNKRRNEGRNKGEKHLKYDLDNPPNKVPGKYQENNGSSDDNWIFKEKESLKKIFICGDCKREFRNRRTCESHMKNDCGKIFICAKCKKQFSYLASYCRHKKRGNCVQVTTQ